MQAVLSDLNRALNKPASFVLASLGPSTYRASGESCLGSSGWAGEDRYASGPHSLRPRWTDFLNTLMIPCNSLFMSEISITIKQQQPSVVWL